MPEPSTSNGDVLQKPARTLRDIVAPVSVRGVGIHSGAVSTLIITPASPGEGVCFIPDGGAPIAAIAANVADTSRCTVLGADDKTISTVEHLLSAFAGLGITDARITVRGPEVPILDGSALPWVELLQSAGLQDTRPKGGVTVRQLNHPIVVVGKNGSFLVAYPARELSIMAAAVFEHSLVGTQAARYAPQSGSDYKRDVAPARTFGFIEEVEALRKAGRALGGSLDNAVVVYPDRYSSPLRFPSELAYHKLLDVMGDLFLAFGAPLPLAVDIVAVKPSHRLNVELASRLRDAVAADTEAPS